MHNYINIDNRCEHLYEIVVMCPGIVCTSQQQITLENSVTPSDIIVTSRNAHFIFAIIITIIRTLPIIYIVMFVEEHSYVCRRKQSTS